jgi:hypothetical protein
LLIGIYGLIICGAFAVNSRIYWPLISLLCLLNLPLVPFSGRFIDFAVPISVFAIIAYCWLERPRGNTPPSNPTAASPAFLVATLAILLPIGLMAYVFVYKPRKVTAQTDLSALYGQRMVNRRGAWRVESYSVNGRSQPGLINSISFLTSNRCESRSDTQTQSGSYFSYTQTIHMSCLPKSISPSGSDFQPLWQGPHLILQTKDLQLTLTRDHWGPGYYTDLLPAFLTK